MPRHGRRNPTPFTQVAKHADFPEIRKPARDIEAPGIREPITGDFHVFYEVRIQIDIHAVYRVTQLIDEASFASEE